MQHKESSSVKIVPKELTCASCNRLFEEPKLLECLHTVCQTCIRKLRVTQKGVYSFKCPSCNHLTKATDYADFSGINLPTNVYMLGLLEIYSNRKTLESRCLVCSSKNDKTQAAFKCLDCGDTLCRVCSRGHTSSSSTSDHAVVSLDKLRVGIYDMDVLRRQSVSCTKHKETYRFFCNTCASLVCEMCALGEHKLHRQTTLDKALEEKSETLQKILPAGHSVMAITNRIAELIREEERFKSRIMKDTAKLTDIIFKARKSILGAAKAIFDKELESLESQLSVFSRETMAMYYKVRKVGGNEFLALSESLETALKTTKESMPSDIILPPLKRLHAQVNGFPPGSKLMTLVNETEGVKDQVFGSVFEGRGTFEVEKGTNVESTTNGDSKTATMPASKIGKGKTPLWDQSDSKEVSMPEAHNPEVTKPDKVHEETAVDKIKVKCPERGMETKNDPTPKNDVINDDKGNTLDQQNNTQPGLNPDDERKGSSDQTKETTEANSLVNGNAPASVINKQGKEASVKDDGTEETSVPAGSADKASGEGRDGKKVTTDTTVKTPAEIIDQRKEKKGKNNMGPKTQNQEGGDIKTEQAMTKQSVSKQPSTEASKKENKTISKSTARESEGTLIKENGGGDLLKTAPQNGKAPETRKPNEKKGARKKIQDIGPLKTPVFEMTYRGLKYKNQFTVKLSSDQRPPNISCLEASSDGSMVVLDDNNCKVMFFDNTFMYNTFIRKRSDQFVPKVVAQPNGYAAVNNNALMFFQSDLVLCSAIFLEKNLSPVQRISPVLCKYDDALMVGNLPGNVMRYYDHVGMVRGSWVSRVRGPITSLRHISGDRFVMCSWAFKGAVFIESQREGIILSIYGEFKGQRNDPWHPWDACVTAMGSVIVSDCLRDELAIFNRHGQLINRMKTGNHGLQEPRCLMVDGRNRLLVSCRGGIVAEFVLNDL